MYTARNGTEYHAGNKGQLTTLRTRGGTEARFDAEGKVRSIHSSGMTINHGPRGDRVVETRLKDGGRVVVVGPHRGFVERPFMRSGQPYMTRTYVYGGHPEAVVYRGYYYQGVPYYRYVPPYYYRPAFYGWAYNPWPAPVPYAWGWAASPWYGYYGYYFTPYPVYPYPALWLTDFLLAENLQAAYASQAALSASQAAANAPSVYISQNSDGAPPAVDLPPEPAPAPDNASVTLTPEVKQAIAEQVRMEVAAEQVAATTLQPEGPTDDQPAATNQQLEPPAEQPSANRPVEATTSGPLSAENQRAAATSTNQVPELLDPKVTMFVVSKTLSAQTADGTVCSLSPGDILTRMAATPDSNQNVRVLVTSSQNNDCKALTQLDASLQDLQDMHNDFRQKIDHGLQALADAQGKNGIASAPPADPRRLEEGQAQPDADAIARLDQQQMDADRAEAAVRQAQESGQGDGGGRF
jgi:hypothetical protein